MPSTIIIILMILTFISKSGRRRKKLGLTTIITFFFFTNSVIINEIYLLWELPPTPYYEIRKPYKSAIILSGVINKDKVDGDRIHFSRGADRVLHTVDLYKGKFVEKIVVTGGSGKILQDSILAADLLKKALVNLGVDKNDIILEKRSRNTYENARFTTEILSDRYPGENHLIVTSAFHMRRARACFRKSGLASDPFSTDFYGHRRRYTVGSFIIPSQYAMHKWTIIIKEWVGMIAYKVMGYA